MADEATTDTTTEATEAPADVVDAPSSAAEAEGGDLSTVLGGEDDTASAEVAEAPVIPETYDLKLADDQPIDAEVLEQATPILKELKLSQDDAQKLMPFAKEISDRSAAAAIANHQIETAQSFGRQVREWEENAKGDAEIGGKNWGETVKLSAKALDMLGFPAGSDFRKLLNESGFGNHPDMIRAFRRIGERISEDSFARGEVDTAKTDVVGELYPNNRRSKS